MLRTLWALPYALLIAASPLAPSQAQDSAEPLVLLSPGLPGPAFPQSDELREALGERNHARSADLLEAMDLTDLPGRTVGAHAFVTAWSLLRAGKGEDAGKYLNRIQSASEVPGDYLALTIAEIHQAKGDPIQAAAALELVPQDSILHGRAMLVRAQSLKDAGRTRDALDVYEDLVQREDPAEGSAKALWALAKKRGLTNPASQEYLVRLWSHYPATTEGQSAQTALEQQGFGGTAQQRLERARAWMATGAWRTLIRSLEPHKSSFGTVDSTHCEFAYILGRAYFKKNEVTKAAALLGPTGRQCNVATPDLGPKMLYLAGKSAERKKEWASAARHYLAIPKLYATSSYADDGYALGGIAQHEAGLEAQAVETWSRQVDAYPTGDLAGEAFWRLAWGAYQKGDTAGAKAWAQRTLRELPISVDPEHYRAALYWLGRWELYPDVNQPHQVTNDAAARQRGLELLQRVLVDHTTSYYAIQAASRLAELAPQRLSAIRRLATQRQPRAWKVSAEFADSPHIQRGIQLSRLGLRQEALSEFRHLEREDLLATEATYIAKIRWASGDDVGAHDFLRRFLQTRPPEEHEDFLLELLRQAYPSRFYEEVKAATVDYDWDPRIFHALVREESNFNQNIVSWAGARGLSQLMPRTAQRVAGWLQLPYSKRRLFEPEYNLRIGSRYFHFLMERYNNNAFLAMAGYNAGEGNVGKWRKRFGDLPTDEWVEQIPIRQTRHYVKRVSGTWQTYHWLYDPGSPSLEMSAFNHDIVPN